MSQLIAFISENMYIVIVIVGVIYSMFFRKSATERAPKRMPDFGSGGRAPAERAGGVNPNNPRMLERSPTESHLPVSEQPVPVTTSAARPIRVARSQQEEGRRTQQEVSNQQSARDKSAGDSASGVSTPRASASSSRASSSSSSSQLNDSQNSKQPSLKSVGKGIRSEDLARAVVWSEILGPPRARRPHRR